MTYHISFSQDGRPYSLMMFLGMVGLYFFLRHLRTHRKLDLALAALSFVLLFYTSYSSIPFILLSQILWLYQMGEEGKKPRVTSFLILNGIIFLLCAPWILFLMLNYKGQPIANTYFVEDFGSLWNILLGTFNDWVPFAPLTMVTLVLLILFLFLSPCRKNALLLLGSVFLPVGGLFLFSKLFHIQHFLRSIGFKQVRIRHYNGLCRIEVSRDKIPLLLTKRNRIVDKLNKFGYNYVAVDLAGYRTGSLNEVIK
jgi:uncharacterized membrane protein